MPKELVDVLPACILAVSITTYSIVKAVMFQIAQHEEWRAADVHVSQLTLLVDQVGKFVVQETSVMVHL